MVIFIFALLVAVYGLSYSGTFTTDDEHIFASGAQSLARLGRLSAEQVYGNSRVQGDFRGIEPALPALGSLLDRLAAIAGLGSVQTMFMLNIFVTALTACLVFLIVLRLGYRAKVAVLAALAYGLGTSAWPYAKTFFRDPLAALMGAGAVLCFEMALAERQSPARRLAHWGLVATLLAGGMMAKGTTAALILALPIAALSRAQPRIGHSRSAGLGGGASTLVLAGAAGAGLVGGFIIMTRLIPPGGALARLSWDHLAFLLRFFFTTPHPAFWQAVAGPLISPGKSVFLYSPVLILAIISLGVGRKRWREFLTPWLVVGGLIVAQALFYDDEWWGNINWGLRFLLPALPLLAVAAAPALEALLTTSSHRARIAGWALIAASGLVQIEAVLLPTRAYYVALARLGPQAAGSLALWDPRHSALLYHLRLLLGVAWEVAWARMWPTAALTVTLVSLGWLLLLAVSVWGLHRALTGQPTGNGGARFKIWPACPSPGDRNLELLLALGLAVGLPYAMLRAYRADPAYYGDRAAFHSAAEFVARNAGSTDVVLLEGYAQPVWHFYLNYARAPVAWYSLPLHFPTEAELEQVAQTGDAGRALMPSAIELFERLPGAHHRAWLINDLDAPAGGFRLAEQWLAGRYAPLGEWTFGRDGQVRISLFSLEAHPLRPVSPTSP